MVVKGRYVKFAATIIVTITRSGLRTSPGHHFNLLGLF